MSKWMMAKLKALRAGDLYTAIHEVEVRAVLDLALMLQETKL
jgi:hypothetical protein